MSKLVIFTAPSGAGKTTIVRHLLGKYDQLAFSVSATTRERRPHEEDGKDYYFLSQEDFEAKVAAGDFLEWEEVYRDNFYGTLKTEIERIWAKGKHVIFDIDVSGGMRIKRKFPERTIAIFIKPPDLNELVRRLKDRGEESEEKISMRVAKAPAELATAPLFDEIVLNANLDEALENAYKLVSEFIKS